MRLRLTAREPQISLPPLPKPKFRTPRQPPRPDTTENVTHAAIPPTYFHELTNTLCFVNPYSSQPYENTRVPGSVFFKLSIANVNLLPSYACTLFCTLVQQNEMQPACFHTLPHTLANTGGIPLSPSTNFNRYFHFPASVLLSSPDSASLTGTEPTHHTGASSGIIWRLISVGSF